MLIKKVSLENYRSHSNKTVEFTRGVNLILGKNGKGKSSILEAISSVMFNMNDRTGRERGKNYIKYGEQNAKVEIEFTANDERDYILITTFSQKKPRKQRLIDKITEEEYHNDDVKTMLDVLCGIKRGYEKIYENIVIAKQNEFINVFKESPSEREKIFNKIFNTDVYKDMCEFFKIARDKYKNEKINISTQIDVSKDNMEDREEVLLSLKNEQEKRDDLENKRNDLAIEVDNLIRDIENYNTTDIELKNLSENEFLNETLKIKDILKDYINKLIENNYPLKFEDDLDVGQILKAFSIKFERNEDLLLNLFEWIKILNEILGYEILFFINLGNFLSEDELVEFSKFIVYNKYKVVFLENFYRSKLSDSDNLIIIDNDLCEIF